ncbi:MAG TPA: DUF3267 domain-containing protein [Tenuifilaceae bacterium]|nr:DUF3267 domain-containing protein [Tenuifilaceae bacterium]HPI44281.1 DUF3267 domain-containing protein [Tenuifilaceae bacterium]HPN20390.1 DUF3267 domain-containing protein [Tenuifilaceae bacterium]HPV56318.1 DUF3267 domain-containing protein [Tenuifilaceae bacterium]
MGSEIENNVEENKVIKSETMSALNANIIAFVMLLPIAIICIVPFMLIWRGQLLLDGFSFLRSHQIFLLLILVLGIVIHEGLHGLTWGVFAKGGLKSIRFGIKWAYLTPYCHCNEPLRRNHYLLGGIMPGLVLGLFPVIVALIFGIGWLLLLGIFFIGAAGGDLMVLFKLIKVDKKHLIQDHPNEIGFLVLRDS